jgi:aquaporin Z
MKKTYLTELLGTFLLVFTIGCVSGPLSPLAIGAALMAAIYAGGHVSGAHYNPGVTIAAWIRGKVSAKEVPGYLIAQAAGAMLAALAVVFLIGKGEAIVIASLPKALFAEFLFSMALITVVLHVATAKGTAGNPFYGAAIGLVVIAGAVAVGGISGGAFNSAVALGLAGMGRVGYSEIWIHIVPNLAAGLLAPGLFRLTDSGD